jgi:amino acid permease
MRRNFLLILLLFVLNSNAQIATDSPVTTNQSAPAIYRIDSTNIDSLNDEIRKMVDENEAKRKEKSARRSNWLTIILIVSSVLTFLRVLLFIRRR